MKGQKTRASPPRMDPTFPITAGAPLRISPDDEYNQDIDLKKLGADLHVDAIVDPANLRHELITRLARARRRETWPVKRRSVTPV